MHTSLVLQIPITVFWQAWRWNPLVTTYMRLLTLRHGSKWLATAFRYQEESEDFLYLSTRSNTPVQTHPAADIQQIQCIQQGSTLLCETAAGVDGEGKQGSVLVSQLTLWFHFFLLSRWRLDKLLEEKFMGDYKINSPHIWLRKPWTALLKAVKLYACIHIHLHIHMHIHIHMHMYRCVYTHVYVTVTPFSYFFFGTCLCLHLRQDAGMLSAWFHKSHSCPSGTWMSM